MLVTGIFISLWCLLTANTVTPLWWPNHKKTPKIYDFFYHNLAVLKGCHRNYPWIFSLPHSVYLWKLSYAFWGDPLPNQKYSMKNLAFHSQMKNDDIANSQYLNYAILLDLRENVLFELGSGRVRIKVWCSISSHDTCYQFSLHHVYTLKIWRMYFLSLGVKELN